MRTANCAVLQAACDAAAVRMQHARAISQLQVQYRARVPATTSVNTIRRSIPPGTRHNKTHTTACGHGRVSWIPATSSLSTHVHTMLGALHSHAHHTPHTPNTAGA